jgi:hypothetical protein
VSQSSNENLETPRELGERYRRERRELVDDGEISASVAKRILDDLFEPAAAGEPRTLRWSVWSAYVEESDRNASVACLSTFRKK